MSYSLSATGSKADVADTTREAIAAYDPPGSAAAESREHLDAVADVVAGLAAVVGTDDDNLAVSISGHANVDHKPADGWADEQIIVSVRVVRS